MAAALAASNSAVSALNNLASTIMSVYDAVGDRKVGQSDLIFSITDWASLIRFAEQPLQRALERRETHARALRVLDLNTALANWLAGIGFKMTSAEAGWRRPRVRSQLPHFFLAKKAARFEPKLELVKKELMQLLEEIAKLTIQSDTKVVPYIDSPGKAAPVKRIEELPPAEKIGPDVLPQTAAVISRLRYATEKIGTSTRTPTGKRVYSAPPTTSGGPQKASIAKSAIAPAPAANGNPTPITTHSQTINA